MVLFNKFIKENGQGLIEAMVALGAAVIVISTIAVAVITAVNNSDFSKNQNTASAYAQQGLEIVRDKAENNWTTFSTYTSTYCLNKDVTDLATRPDSQGNCALIDNVFVRKINISQNDSNCTNGTGSKVKSMVSWSDGKCTDTVNNKYCHTVQLESCMANINSVPSL
ncbi:MAG: hypothetical protein A3B38_01130 [Candidatus Levybacteria bacterium RIFCSPLOWO2_01_FULL_36_13]|nr:MAG: hypothetical protein A2684_02370 [Candidatus Levybacteria bacterium RIFCSPHIGHO2_01_FULL_36_15b]OGH35489.1 MAG: hypothetical protein A3B38_01130 [Candidatus Levybacteria bacterium RIFCSPLOWO2_01_FULL_36_13]